MPNNNKKQGTVGKQDQMLRGGQSSQNFGNPKRNTGSVGHDRESVQGEGRHKGMPAKSGRSQSEMGRSDEDGE